MHTGRIPAQLSSKEQEQDLADSMAMLILQAEPERRGAVIDQIGETYAEHLRKLRPGISDDQIRAALENLIRATVEREQQIERSGGAGGGTA